MMEQVPGKRKPHDDYNCFQSAGKVAIMIDGGFFIKRLHYFTQPDKRNNVDYIVQKISILCNLHARRLGQSVYRIFFYDCPPLENGAHNPLSKRFVSFKNTDQYKFKHELFARLRKMRKMALRLGKLNHSLNKWTITPDKIDALLRKEITVDNLDPDKDIIPNVRQKQVDMKIGVDITSLVLKRQVDSIVLVAGDGDFVPAAKLARREGIDFILDPMWNKIQPDLNEHIDGLSCVLFRNRRVNGLQVSQDTQTEDADE